jgi:EAL domain-containing protein (putative c-di-GMP-specific phosphodiesterase class I)
VLLRLAGCDEMQGFLFAKACPAEAIDKILARTSARATAKRPSHPAS